MERPFTAYSGDDHYAFICYAHDDQAVVYPELSWLNDHGINVWYDEGIDPGSEWSDAIADAIEGCATFIYFISPRSVSSEHCRRELNYALSHGLNVQAVHLEATTIERGLELSLSNRQAILKHELDEDRYHEKLLQSLQQTRTTKPTVPTKAPNRSRRNLRRAIVLGIAAVSLAALSLVVVSFLAPAPEPEGAGKTDVFLRPVRDLSADEELHFAEALTTEILAKFGSVAGWRPHLLTTETTYGDGYVVEPSIRRTADAVRLSVKVKRTGSDEVLKAFSTDDTLLADEVSLRRLAMLVGYVAYGAIDNERIRRESFERIGSYAAVDTMEAARKKGTVAAFFDPDACQQAITLDPGFSPGYVCLASLLMLSPDADLIAQGTQLLNTARALDPNNSDIYRTEAIVPLMHEKDYPEAERLLRKALELNPFSDQIPNTLAWLLLVTGRVDESVAIYQRLLPLVRNSDPWTALVAGYQFGVAARTAGRHSELVQELEFESIVGEPHKLRMALALTELDDPRAQPMLDDLLLVWNEIYPRQRDLLMLALQRSGRTAEAAQRHLEVATYAETTPGTTGETWALWGLTHYAVAEGNLDDAFKWLQLARANDPDFVLLVASLSYTRNQRYATLREDPRFTEVVKWARTPLSARNPN